jgi:hypothetical protein
MKGGCIRMNDATPHQVARTTGRPSCLQVPCHFEMAWERETEGPKPGHRYGVLAGKPVSHRGARERGGLWSLREFSEVLQRSDLRMSYRVLGRAQIPGRFRFLLFSLRLLGLSVLRCRSEMHDEAAGAASRPRSTAPRHCCG